MNWFKICSKNKNTKVVPSSPVNSKIKMNHKELKYEVGNNRIINNSEEQQYGNPTIPQIPIMESPTRSVTLDLGGGGVIVTPNSDSELITSSEVTIRDPTSEESTSISGVLHYCKKRILYPYLRLLSVMGLKPFGIPDGRDTLTCSKMMNKIYVGGVIFLLLIGYILQFLTCYRRDRGFTITKEPPHYYGFSDQSNNTNTCDGNPYCSHLFPSLLHFGSFIYMIYLYRVHEDEQLPNLMERVFIQESLARSHIFSKKRLLRTLQLMGGFTIIWIIFSTGSQLIQITTHTFNINNPWIKIRKEIKDVLITILIISGLWQDAIQCTVIVSYCIHCRLLSTYFNLIHSRIQQHSITLVECIKEIGEVDKLLHYLNNDLTPGVGPLLIMDTTFAVSSISFIIDKGNHLQTLDLISLAMITILWVLIVVHPMFESAKLSTSCKRIRELGHLVRMRPFGYQDTPQADLDSFLLFVSTLKMDVHICRIPISAPVIAFIIASTISILLIWGLIFV